MGIQDYIFEVSLATRTLKGESVGHVRRDI